MTIANGLPQRPGTFPPVLGAADIRRAAQTIGCDEAAVRAVLTVETGGRGGFLPDGRPRILFEAHLFSRATRGRFDATHPLISSPRWNRELYIGNAGEYPRLEAAAALDRNAALASASWGLFQILGMNHRHCGYPTVEAFVAAMYESESRHMEAFVSFIRSRGLAQHLVSRSWRDFARGYNGPGFEAHGYHTKLEKNYERHLNARPRTQTA